MSSPAFECNARAADRGQYPFGTPLGGARAVSVRPERMVSA